MKQKFVVTLTLLLFGSLALAGENRLEPFEPSQNPDALYRLFHTHNIYTLLKLDTRAGQIWQVQWGQDQDSTSIFPINTKALAIGTKPGRFTLYPTHNMYTFILLDQEKGDTWHVQWGQTENQRFVAHMEE